jgi:hypothetical protein
MMNGNNLQVLVYNLKTFNLASARFLDGFTDGRFQSSASDLIVEILLAKRFRSIPWYADPVFL